MSTVFLTTVVPSLSHLLFPLTCFLSPLISFYSRLSLMYQCTMSRQGFVQSPEEQKYKYKCKYKYKYTHKYKYCPSPPLLVHDVQTVFRGLILGAPVAGLTVCWTLASLEILEVCKYSLQTNTQIHKQTSTPSIIQQIGRQNCIFTFSCALSSFCCRVL